MNNQYTIIFSYQAQSRLNDIVAYIYKNTKSKSQAKYYVLRIKEFLKSVLSYYPEAGRDASEFGENIRKIVYQKYSILYMVEYETKTIKVTTLFRENLP